MSTALLKGREQIPDGFFLVDCAVSGGTLEGFLRSALTVSHGKLCVRIQEQAVDFPLPCLSGQGRSLTIDEVSKLKADHRCFFSEALGTNYFTYTQNSRLHCVLFDDFDSLQYKLSLCRHLKIPMVLFQPPASYPYTGK